ncbi:hypothetical protein [Ornithinimicrobium kibberense]|uniref:hypothetical protein n=1 Tax=Ornithinimicrobium kibberense TaxID=282060 RepID=UPI003617E0EA
MPTVSWTTSGVTLRCWKGTAAGAPTLRCGTTSTLTSSRDCISDRDSVPTVAWTTSSVTLRWPKRRAAAWPTLPCGTTTARQPLNATTLQRGTTKTRQTANATTLRRGTPTGLRARVTTKGPLTTTAPPDVTADLASRPDTLRSGQRAQTVHRDRAGAADRRTRHPPAGVRFRWSCSSGSQSAGRAATLLGPVRRGSASRSALCGASHGG